MSAIFNTRQVIRLVSWYYIHLTFSCFLAGSAAAQATRLYFWWQVFDCRRISLRHEMIDCLIVWHWWRYMTFRATLIFLFIDTYYTVLNFTLGIRFDFDIYYRVKIYISYHYAYCNAVASMIIYLILLDIYVGRYHASKAATLLSHAKMHAACTSTNIWPCRRTILMYAFLLFSFRADDVRKIHYMNPTTETRKAQQECKS